MPGEEVAREMIQHAVWLDTASAFSLGDVELIWPSAASWSATRPSASGACASAGYSLQPSSSTTLVPQPIYASLD